MTISSEILAGLLFLVFGAAAIVLGWSYGFGSLTALGAGALPVMAGAGLCALGAVQLLRAMRAGPILESAFSRAEIRPLLFVLAAVLAFALLIVPLGLIPALAALIAVAWFAQKGDRPWEIVAAIVVVAAVIVAIFHLGLGIPFRLFAWGG